jgi:O-antigen/teichoic acid export membrane protein
MTSFATLRNQVLKVAGSGVGGQAITFLSLPILSRLYTPEAFGGWALFVSAAIMLGTIATLRYELAVVLPRRDGTAASLVGAGFAASLVTALLAALALPLIARWMIGPDDARTIGPLLWLLPVFVLAAAAYQLGLAWCTRRDAFGVYSLGQFTLPAATALGQALAALAGFDTAGGLILGSVLGYVAGALLLWSFSAAGDGAILLRGLAPARIGANARRYYKYPAFMTPYTLLSAARDRAIYFLLGGYVGGRATGFYAMAQRFTNIPNSLVAGAIRPVFFQFAARRELAGMAPMVAAIMAALLVLAVPNLIVFLFFAGPILGLLFGQEWVAAAPFASLLAVPAVPLLLGNWMDRVFDISNRQGLAFRLEAIFSVVTLAALFTGFWVTGQAIVAVAMQAAAMFIYFSVWNVIAFRIAGFDLSYLGRVAMLAAGLAAASAGLLWILLWSLPPLAAAAIFYAVYLAALIPAALRYGRRISAAFV